MAQCNETYKSEPHAEHIHACTKEAGHSKTDEIPLHMCTEECHQQWFSQTWEPTE